MNPMTKNAQELPEDVEMLLPWHAAGTLSRRDAARVEAALANDNELATRYELIREELGEAMRGLDVAKLPESELLQTRGW